MDFPTSLKLLHLLAIAMTGCGLLVFIHEAGLRAFDASRTQDCMRLPSIVMMVGMFLVCMTAGGLSTLSFFSADGLSDLSLLVVRGVSLASLSLSCIGLHLYVWPMFSSDTRISFAMLGDVAAASLLAGIACTALLLWNATGIAAQEIVSLGLPQLAQAIGLMTLILTLSFLAVLSVAIFRHRGAFAHTSAQHRAPQQTIPRAFEPAIFAPRRPHPRPHFDPTFNLRYSEAALHAAQ